MFYFIDESGNTGLNIFDENQPKLYYGVLSCQKNLDLIAAPLMTKCRKKLGVKRIHANELGVGRLLEIAPEIIEFSKKNDVRFSFFKVLKPDHAVICFFDQVFDSALNKAISWNHYFSPLRYPLLLKLAMLFDEELAKLAWNARKAQNPVICAEMLCELCKRLRDRVDLLPDARSRELISGALHWAEKKPMEIDYGAGNKDSALQISPNLIGFQQVLQDVATQSSKRGRKARKITVDRQSQFNEAQGELAEWYSNLRKSGHVSDLGPGMPSFDYSKMPEVPPTFRASDESAGLEMVDVTLWIAKRIEEGKDVPIELRKMFWSQAKRGSTDEVSLKAIDQRWRFLLDLPEPSESLHEEIEKHFEQIEAERKKEVEALTR